MTLPQQALRFFLAATPREIAGRSPRFRTQAAFTMVEIAICLAVIGFALVAIIGVLPIGMNVQKDNREANDHQLRREVFDGHHWRRRFARVRMN